MKKSFEEVFEDQTKYGTKVKTDEYCFSGTHIIVDQGQGQIAGYTNREDGLFVDVPAIVFGDHTRVIKYVDAPFFLGADGVKVLRCRFENANYRYLYYALKSTRIPNTGYNRHFKWLKETQINYPAAERQAETVRILDGVMEVIGKRQQQLYAYDDLIKARFVELFGDLANPACTWDKCKLVESCADPDDIKCGPFGTQLGKDEYTASGIAVWEIPQINSEFKTSPTHYLTTEKAAELSAYSIKPGDIAMSRKGNVGRCAVFPETFEEGIIHSDVLRIRVDDRRVVPEFMMRQLHYSRDVQHQIDIVSSGAIMAGINVTKLKQIFVYLPPKGLQDEFAAFVAQVDKSKSRRELNYKTMHRLAS